MWLTETEWNVVLLSLRVAGVAVLASLPFGLFVAWLLARKQFIGKSLFDSVIHLPLVLPPIVVGYLLLVVMGKNGAIGQWLYQWFGFTFVMNWAGAALASAVVSFPLMVRAIRQSLENIDGGLEQVALTLGASKWRVFLTITLPLSVPGILSGMVLAFARSLGEFGATITFASNIEGQTQTIPIAMYTYLQMIDKEQDVMRLCIISILLSMCALLFSELLTRYSCKYQKK